MPSVMYHLPLTTCHSARTIYLFSIHHIVFTTFYLPFVIPHASYDFVIYQIAFTVCPLPRVTYHLSFTTCPFYYMSFTICHSTSCVLYHVSFTLYHFVISPAKKSLFLDAWSNYRVNDSFYEIIDHHKQWNIGDNGTL